MPHPLVTQLQFARSEFVRCIEGVSVEDAVRRTEPMNCISWFVGHLAVQENFYWVYMAQGKTIQPGLNNLVGYGQPASAPLLDDMWKSWKEVTQTADVYLETVTQGIVETNLLFDNGKTSRESIGTMLLRNYYHYWFHTGEVHALRQMLGHKNLSDFVGDMSKYQYSPENASGEGI